MSNGFRTPSKMTLSVDWECYSSGLKHIQLEGDSLGVVAALRSIASGEGLGVPHEYRTSVTLMDSGSRHGSIYAVASEQLPVKGRRVSAQEAYRTGRDILIGLGAIVDDGEFETLCSDPAP